MKTGAESLDTVGVIARSVEDAALLAAGSSMRKDLIVGNVLANPRLAVCRSPNWHQMSREGADAFLATVDKLGGHGARMFEREMPFDALDNAATTILFYEMARGLAYEMARHRARVSPMLVQRVEEGSAIPYAEYAKALAYAADCRKRLADLMGDVDAILTPSTTGEAPLGLESTGNTAMNRLWTLLYGPCVTVPAGVGPAGMPLGVQLVGLPRTDARTLAAARWVETRFAEEIGSGRFS
jgi:Asp-tRNA(Asn)/Glu-tRNA(Gln) amidotransferase A subunit family amidase